MSLVHQQVSSYRLVRQLRANQDYKVYQAEHKRSSEKRIIQIAKLEGKLNKKESRTRLRQYVESIRVINSKHIIPILKYDFAKIKGKNYFYIITPCFISESLKEWLQLRVKTKPLSQHDVDDIMHQAREAVEVYHKLGIVHLNIELSSFMIETTANPKRSQVFLNDFLLAVLSTERSRKDEVRRKEALTQDQNALQEMEKLLNQNVEETGIESAESLESPLQILERRLVIAEEERIIRDLQVQKESDTKLLAEAVLATASVKGADAIPIAPSGGGTSGWSGRWFWALGTLLLLTLMLSGTICVLAGLFFFGKPAWAFGSSSAKVTITQAAYELTGSYIFTGVTHSITQVKTQSITVPATNLVLIPGRSARGTLTFHITQSRCNVARAIPAGTVFTGSHGISMVTDHVAILRASCTATVAAHAVKIGPTGDIGAHDMKQTYHTTIIVDNPAAFVGGLYEQSYTTVQQSDIDHAASSLAVRLKQETLNVLHMQLLTNEQFVSSPQCKSKVTSDHQVNDAATNLNVTVTETCTAEFYNPQEIISRSERMLNERAQALFGSNYVLADDIKAEITHVATDVKQGTLITVVTSGLWTYQFSSARADQLARLITGKDKQDTQSILSNQKGVQSVSINISNNDNTMPSNANSINIAYATTLVPIEKGAASSFIY